MQKNYEIDAEKYEKYANGETRCLQLAIFHVKLPAHSWEAIASGIKNASSGARARDSDSGSAIFMLQFFICQWGSLNTIFRSVGLL